MNLLDKYLQGDHLQVYAEIQNLGERAFDSEHYPTVEAVLAETFKRVSHNLEIIYAELIKINYGFKKQIKYDFQEPLLKPPPDTEVLFRKLDIAVKKFGYVPLSLKAFYKIIGSCNFAWDYDENPEIPWEGADPLQISPLSSLLSNLESMDDDLLDLQVSADYLHKDNISGGPPYSVEITPNPSIDGLFLNEEHDTTFINYLRLTMENCGFSRAEECMDINDFARFQEVVRSKLYTI